MNAARRKALDEATDKLSNVRTILETARDEEQDFYDNMPESFQSGERGEKAQASIDALESAINSLDEIDSYLEEATQ
jgi:hypothetical protein